MKQEYLMLAHTCKLEKQKIKIGLMQEGFWEGDFVVTTKNCSFSIGSYLEVIPRGYRRDGNDFVIDLTIMFSAVNLELRAEITYDSISYGQYFWEQLRSKSISTCSGIIPLVVFTGESTARYNVYIPKQVIV